MEKGDLVDPGLDLLLPERGLAWRKGGTCWQSMTQQFHVWESKTVKGAASGGFLPWKAMTAVGVWPQQLGQNRSVMGEYVRVGSFLHQPPTAIDLAKVFCPLDGDLGFCQRCKVWMLPENAWDKSWERG